LRPPGHLWVKVAVILAICATINAAHTQDSAGGSAVGASPSVTAEDHLKEWLVTTTGAEVCRWQPPQSCAAAVPPAHLACSTCPRSPTSPAVPACPRCVQCAAADFRAARSCSSTRLHSSTSEAMPAPPEALPPPAPLSRRDPMTAPVQRGVKDQRGHGPRAVCSRGHPQARPHRQNPPDPGHLAAPTCAGIACKAGDWVGWGHQALMLWQARPAAAGSALPTPHVTPTPTPTPPQIPLHPILGRGCPACLLACLAAGAGQGWGRAAQGWLGSM
jgi:hypothetical protein